QQRRLRRRRGAVDLVGEDDVGEERALQELKLALSRRAVLLDDLGARDVGRHQVGGELDAAEVEREALGQRRDHERLRQTGDAFEDAVTAAEKRDQQLLNDLVLADDNAAQLGLDIVER